jgi:cytochrome c oxidase assembly protein subunit 11
MSQTRASGTARDRANRRLFRRFGLAAIAMFGFGYALVPLYNVFCEVTGLNGKTGSAVEQVAGPVDRSRTVTVEFTASVNQGMPWEFRPVQKRMQVHPGEEMVALYTARNTTSDTIVGQAVPSVSPGAAATYFKKIECFCFSRQELKAGEAREMPVRFVVDPKLDPAIRTVTLSYTFFNTDRLSAQKFGDTSTAMPADHVHSGPHGAGS